MLKALNSPSLNNLGRGIQFADDIKVPVIIQLEYSLFVFNLTKRPPKALGGGYGRWR